MSYFTICKLTALSLVVVLLPLYAKAQSGRELAQDFVVKINEAILFPLISLLLGVAILVFVYGSFEYVINSDNDDGRKKGRQHILWGVVGLLVMISALAILEIAANTFGLGNELDEARPILR